MRSYTTDELWRMSSSERASHIEECDREIARCDKAIALWMFVAKVAFAVAIVCSCLTLAISVARIMGWQ